MDADRAGADARGELVEGRFKGEFITITPPLVHFRSEVITTLAWPVDSRRSKYATSQTVVSANSGRWGRLRFAEVLTMLSTE